MTPTVITDEASQDPAAVTRLCRRFGIESVDCAASRIGRSGPPMPTDWRRSGHGWTATG